MSDEYISIIPDLDKMNNLTYEKGKTSNGIKYEQYFTIKNKNQDSSIIFLAGTNVKRGELNLSNYETVNKSNYMGMIPAKVASESKVPVSVVYQPGVSNFKHYGIYSQETEKMQLEAAIELAGKKPFTPITHSLSTILGIRLLDKEFRKQYSEILPGVLSAVMTNARDALTDENGNPRKLLGLIDWYPLFKLAENIPHLLSYYPLASQEIHDNLFERQSNNKNWGGMSLISTSSAKYLLNVDGLEVVKSLKNQDQKPLCIVTVGDKIFPHKKQSEICEKLDAKILRLDAGHRWFTESNTGVIIDAISEFHKKNLEDIL